MHIARTDGLLAWWNGLLPSLVLVCNPAVNFMVYEALKRNILPTLALWVRRKFSQKLCIALLNSLMKVNEYEKKCSKGVVVIHNINNIIIADN